MKTIPRPKEFYHAPVFFEFLDPPLKNSNKLHVHMYNENLENTMSSRNLFNRKLATTNMTA